MRGKINHKRNQKITCKLVDLIHSLYHRQRANIFTKIILKSQRTKNQKNVLSCKLNIGVLN